MPEDIEELKNSYKGAIEYEKDTFLFEGQEMSTAYVKYLLEYLKDKEKK
jgi:hypothetical protein